MTITNFVWDDLSDNILMETDENNVPIANYTNEPGQFGEVLSQHRHGQDHYFHFDGLGSTRNLTDQNQAVSDSYTYTAFGEPVASSGSTPNPFQFNGALGYYTNTETSDMYVRRRTFAASVARWLSRDPLGFFDGPNMYTYVKNNTINKSDPTGMCVCCCCPAALSLSSIELVVMPQPGLPENESYGLKFRVVANLNRIENRIEGDAMCRIEWYECSIVDGSEGQNANEWFRIPGTPPTDAFTDWFSPPPEVCPAWYERYWEDRPVIFNQLGWRTAIKFAVRVSGPPGCGCQPREIVKLFRIDVTVTADGGILNPPTVAPNPPTLIEGVDNGDPADCNSGNIPWESAW